MLTPTTPLPNRLVPAITLAMLGAVYAADAPPADAAAKDACIKVCNKYLRACRKCILGCDRPGCEKTCLTCIETCRTYVSLVKCHSAMAEEMCEVGEEACEQSDDECTKCGDNPCGKACAATFMKCHDAYRAMRR